MSYVLYYNIEVTAWLIYLSSSHHACARLRRRHIGGLIKWYNIIRDKWLPNWSLSCIIIIIHVISTGDCIPTGSANNNNMSRVCVYGVQVSLCVYEMCHVMLYVCVCVCVYKSANATRVHNIIIIFFFYCTVTRWFRWILYNNIIIMRSGVRWFKMFNACTHVHIIIIITISCIPDRVFVIVTIILCTAIIYVGTTANVYNFCLLIRLIHYYFSPTPPYRVLYTICYHWPPTANRV